MRVYTTSYNGTITNAGGNTDLLVAKPAANKPIYLSKFSIANLSDFGDAQEEAIRITVQRFPATVTDGSGGAAVTPQPYDENDSAAGFTCRANDTTVATTSGTAVILAELGWNERNTPMEWNWPEMIRSPRAQNAEAIVIRCESTVADDVSANWWAEWTEY